VEKAFVVQGLANKLWATENSMDAAIADASKLMAGIIEARQEINVSHIVIDPSVKKLAEAISAMSEARAALIETHHAMAEAKLRIGVRTKLVGTVPSEDKKLHDFEDADVRRAG
jgi:hypothetical protein